MFTLFYFTDKLFKCGFNYARFCSGLVVGWNNNELDIEELKQQIPGLENDTNIPSVEEIHRVVQEKCNINGGEDAFNNLQVGRYLQFLSVNFGFYTLNLFFFQCRFLITYSAKLVLKLRVYSCPNNLYKIVFS